MNNDTERYKLCYQCILEQFGDSRLHKYLLKDIDRRMSTFMKWTNVLAGIHNGMLVGCNKICKDCPYVTEHVALACEPVIEINKEIMP